MSDNAYLILCYHCISEIPLDQITGIFYAKYGPQGDSDHKVLACPPWRQRWRDVPGSKFLCDGCGRPVAVARSSGWFVDEHRRERVG